MCRTYVVTILFLLLVSPAFSIPIGADENCVGHGFFSGMAPPLVIACQLSPDPFNDNRLVPTFTFPDFLGSVLPGDVLISEPGERFVSDVIRFFGGNRMLFYSDRDENDSAKSDVGLPSTFPFPIAIVNSDNNGLAIYIPAIGQPGFSPNNQIEGYQFISDVEIPEPASIGLIAVGLAFLGCVRCQIICTVTPNIPHV